MTQEEKQLLLADLCARLPYGVICQLSSGDTSITEKLGLGGLSDFMNGSMKIKPYFRPLSSMTEEEILEFSKIEGIDVIAGTEKVTSATLSVDAIDWLNAHHFDYRGLIPMGLALEAPDDMYK